jgi:NADPH:quinone reductase-like Zn-dependent oxidoreductase
MTYSYAFCFSFASPHSLWAADAAGIVKEVAAGVMEFAAGDEVIYR